MPKVKQNDIKCNFLKVQVFTLYFLHLPASSTPAEYQPPLLQTTIYRKQCKYCKNNTQTIHIATIHNSLIIINHECEPNKTSLIIMIQSIKSPLNVLSSVLPSNDSRTNNGSKCTSASKNLNRQLLDKLCSVINYNSSINGQKS